MFLGKENRGLFSEEIEREVLVLEILGIVEDRRKLFGLKIVGIIESL